MQHVNLFCANLATASSMGQPGRACFAQAVLE